MKNHHIRMLVGCVLIMGSILLLPRFGYGAATGSLVFGLLMLLCCVGPMLLMLFGDRREQDGSRSEEAGEGDRGDKTPGSKPRSGGSCH